MPIIGNGDIAGVLPENPRHLYFASGVSNSMETRESEYKREKDLLESQPRDLRLIYFSSISVFYSDNRYARHKREMEELVKFWFPEYTIIRIGNIDWGDNPHTIINSMRARRKLGQPIEIQNVYRYVVSKDEFLHWVSLIPNFNCEMNIPGERMSVMDLYERYVINQC